MNRPSFIQEDRCIPVLHCRTLIETFERARRAGHLSPNPGGDPYWDDKFLWYSSINLIEIEALLILQFMRRRIAERIRGFYGLKQPIYSDNIQLVHWPVGRDMPAHADNANPDGTPNEYPHRDFGAIVYLNDEYDGGEFYFEKLKWEIKPRAGMLLAFPGDLQHFHGVKKVLRGDRYTAASWYTRDERHRDPSELNLL